MLKLKEELKQHEESVKDKKSRLSAIRRELDEAVEDLNEARKKDTDGTAEDHGDGDGQMAPQVTGSDLGHGGSRPPLQNPRRYPLHRTPSRRHRAETYKCAGRDRLSSGKYGKKFHTPWSGVYVHRVLPSLPLRATTRLVRLAKGSEKSMSKMTRPPRATTKPVSVPMPLSPGLADHTRLPVAMLSASTSPLFRQAYTRPDMMARLFGM